MKFARYLEETQIPEWKRAYIDFKGLKKRITAIRKARQAEKRAHVPSGSPQSNRTAFRYFTAESTGRGHGSLDRIPSQPRENPSSTSLSRAQKTEAAIKDRQGRAVLPHASRSLSEARLPHAGSKSDEVVDGRGSLPRFIAVATRRRTNKSTTGSVATIESLYASLEPLELSFFTYLDHELDKVDSFYNEREREAILRLSVLKDQLHELAEHRRLFHKARKETWTMLPRALNALKMATHSEATEPIGAKDNTARAETPPHTVEAHMLDPSEYQHAKRKLKKAFQEYYRSLELLNDYRVLNLTGFRKAVKKYEKVTRRDAQDLYMKEKVHPRRFAFSGTMDDIMRDVESIYATRFENGDRKRARRRLKSPFVYKTHHFSAFRSGVYMGLAIPALVSGIYRSFQPEARQQIPQWGPLLEIYGTLLIPVVFSLLIGINLLAWTQARINFPFIFELDVRTAIDTREYFELPALLFTTLCWAIWLTFFAIGRQHIAPTTWPIIWIGFAVAIMANPLPVLSRSSRYWLLRNLSRLLVSGTSRVEFADFWMGDQMCSLVFSMGHIFIIGCAYSKDWQNVFGNCGSATHWPVPFVLVALPYFARLVQSIRRWHDSKLPTHLINGGKYLSSMVMYGAYYAWRSRGSRRDVTFVVYCVFAALSSTYTSSWDLLMDWSFLQRHSPHKLLRRELIYTNNTLVYYFAIVSNVLIRFIWVIYIPSGGPSSRIRAAIAAALEMLRRFQWNFYRLENEQIGNTDQYRATREVPLPYSSTRQGEDDEDSDIGEDESPDDAGGVYGDGGGGALHMGPVSPKSPMGQSGGEPAVRSE